MIYDDVFIEMSHNPDLPLWQRLTFRAMGSANAIGHAEFRRGELKDLLGVKVSQRLTEAITTARERGWK